jgi:UPF0716 protein FxsA
MTRLIARLALLLPLLEVPVVVLVAWWIGIMPMILLVVAGAVAGLLVLRHAGLNAVVQLRLALAEGREPGRTMINAACFALAGLLLIIPGFLSDLVALVLFLPWTRDYLLRHAARHFDTRVYGLGAGAGGFDQPGGDAAGSPGGAGRSSGVGSAAVIDGEFSVVETADPEDDSEAPRERRHREIGAP